jgi:16S rRNA (guanine966-N2)-methyltransferase
MRIISGKHKGRSLLVSPKFKGRPTTDFAREGLFNVLQHQVDWDSTSVLDLFAGTGAFGLECSSRGCASVHAVEKEFLHVDWIRKNFRHFEVQKAEVLQMDVFKYIQNYQGPGFDLIFADPPFDLPDLGRLPELVYQNKLLRPYGLFVLEHPRQFDFATTSGFMKMKKYANVHFSFFGSTDDDAE